jgi:hypothetical protein
MNTVRLVPPPVYLRCLVLVPLVSGSSVLSSIQAIHPAEDLREKRSVCRFLAYP